MMGTKSPETCREKKYTKKNCALSWFHLQDNTTEIWTAVMEELFLLQMIPNAQESHNEHVLCK
jgi:hypothetical protein